ncbi:replication protein A 70 kDa DNA-binding subunit B-like [Mercurialis annua]|uniref:replication protein A 70 kDa DNA-binding subunit B-like n=1 Tax=Mercurialis annua TaxID=3986 RepID=UPI00215F6967|nr:replication protein A 70 kDa DNA-binding subunit B-like [Mercurialis annua]
MENNIDLLQPYQKEWSISVMVIRSGSIESYNNGSNKKRKIILVDIKGTKIQAILFNEAVEKFKDCLERGKTYTITNGVVKAINSHYPNVNERIELSLTLYTTVIECAIIIPRDVLIFNFTSFNDVEKISDEKTMVDILGIVEHVKSAFTVQTRMGIPTRKREILLLNDKLEKLNLILWGDLADNEGGEVESLLQNSDQRPIIALSNVKAKIYAEELQLNTTQVTTIEINLDLLEVDELRESYYSNILVNKQVSFLSSPNKFTKVSEVTLKEIIENKYQEIQCYFEATILSVVNSNNPWYNSCNKCSKKIYPNKGHLKCFNCNDENPQYTPRYMLKLLVSDSIEEAYVTIFDNAEILIGCPVFKYMKLNMDGPKEDIQFYKKLMSCQSKQYRFLVMLKKDKEADYARKQMVASDVQEVEDNNSARELRDKEKFKDNNQVIEIKDDVLEAEGDTRLKKKIKIEKD